MQVDSQGKEDLSKGGWLLREVTSWDITYYYFINRTLDNFFPDYYFSLFNPAVTYMQISSQHLYDINADICT